MNNLVLFQGKNIRRIKHNKEWYFSVIDIISALDTSSRARKYWSDLKSKLNAEGFEVSDIIGRLRLVSDDGKLRYTDCVNTKSAFRIIQSIPSKKAEPFKKWLAKVGYERTLEIENPELAHKRAKTYYELKGYPKHWIDKRLRGIAIRQELTDEWNKRGIEGMEYGILTNEISKATFGVTVKDHKRLKGLGSDNQNLRNHMSSLELIFSMLGEASTTEIVRNRNANGFEENKEAAKRGGNVAGRARKNLERESRRRVVSKENYLELES